MESKNKIGDNSVFYIDTQNDKKFPFQPPSRNRRERAELRPDFFDSAAIIEDDSVRFCLVFFATLSCKQISSD